MVHCSCVLYSFTGRGSYLFDSECFEIALKLQLHNYCTAAIIITIVNIEIFATYSHWRKLITLTFCHCIEDMTTFTTLKFYPAKFMYTVSHSVQMIMHRIECLMFIEYLLMPPVQPAYQGTPSHLHLKKGNRQHQYVSSKSG